MINKLFLSAYDCKIPLLKIQLKDDGYLISMEGIRAWRPAIYENRIDILVR